jgi:NADH-quinone oxidoreductase subunit H
VLKEVVIPAGANKTVFLLAPIITFDACAGRLGRDPRGAGLGHRQPQCRHPLPVRDLLAWRLRHHHGRLGFELEVSVPRWPAFGRADGVYEVSIGFIIITVLLLVGSLNLTDIVTTRTDGFWIWHAFAFNFANNIWSACSRCS